MKKIISIILSCTLLASAYATPVLAGPVTGSAIQVSATEYAVTGAGEHQATIPVTANVESSYYVAIPATLSLTPTVTSQEDYEARLRDYYEKFDGAVQLTDAADMVTTPNLKRWNEETEQYDYQVFSGDYKIGVRGNVDAGYRLFVSCAGSVLFYSQGNPLVRALVLQEKDSWTSTEVPMNEFAYSDGEIIAPISEPGTWEGTVVFIFGITPMSGP